MTYVNVKNHHAKKIQNDKIDTLKGNHGNVLITLSWTNSWCTGFSANPFYVLTYVHSECFKLKKICIKMIF